jgi:hypothetical protein
MCALKNGLIQPWGLVTGLPQFSHFDLPGWDDLLVADHEIRTVALADEAMRLASESRAIDRALIQACKADLDRIDRRVRPGTVWNVGATIGRLAGRDIPHDESPREAIARIQSDLKSFAESNRLEHVVVGNVASTEPPVDTAALPPRWSSPDRLLDRPRPWCSTWCGSRRRRGAAVTRAGLRFWPVSSRAPTAWRSRISPPNSRCSNPGPWHVRLVGDRIIGISKESFCLIDAERNQSPRLNHPADLPHSAFLPSRWRHWRRPVIWSPRRSKAD